MEEFAKQLAEVRNLDTKGTYKKSLDELETEYQFVLLQSLTHFYNETRRSNLTERLNLIKEQLSDTGQAYPVYPSDLPFTGWDTNVKVCRQLQTRHIATQTVL